MATPTDSLAVFFKLQRARIRNHYPVEPHRAPAITTSQAAAPVEAMPAPDPFVAVEARLELSQRLRAVPSPRVRRALVLDALELTQGEIAQRVGVSRQTVNAWLQRHRPDISGVPGPKY